MYLLSKDLMMFIEGLASYLQLARCSLNTLCMYGMYVWYGMYVCSSVRGQRERERIHGK